MSTENLSPAEYAIGQPKPPENRAALVIKATHGWTDLGVSDVWRFRELLWFLTLRDIKSRHRQTALGPLWFILKPLITMVVFTLVFGKLAQLPSDGVPYPIFTYTALLPWTFFATASVMAVSSLVTRMDIISKVYFPRLIIPVSAVISNLVDLGMSFIVLLGMMFFYRMPLRWEMLSLPFFVIFAGAIALAIGLWGATLAVNYRDVALGLTFGVQIWMFVTPVAYSAQVIPEQWMWLYQLNPMYWPVEGFRWALLGTGTPPVISMLVPVVVTLLLTVSGAYVFRRTERTIVDLI